ncbi:ROK family protein [Nonomuraea sp. NPDC050663]|uniref:ROK family transcriptional regulator n=1 Tax=Nonomuraea sp. NPDC050663 TaxID=3364370 RepID=UPI0037B4C8EE
MAGPQALLWSINARAVLEAVDALGPTGRPELVKETGLSKTTVAQALQELTARGVVREAGLDTERRGPAATLYGTDPGSGYAVGIDVDMERVAAVLVDLAGAEVARVCRPTIGAEQGVAQAVAGVAVEVAGPRAVGQVVVGVPALVARDRRGIRASRGLPGAAHLGDELHELLPYPVLLENDVNLAAVAEQRRGAGRGVDDFVLLRVGSGLGAGVVIGGRLHRGFAGGAGEVGFLPHPATALGGEVLGARQIGQVAREQGVEGSPAELFARAAAGEASALAVAEATARRLAHVIGAIALVIEPELFVVGGSGTEVLLEPVRRHLAADAPELVASVTGSGVPGDAVLQGAALVAHEHVRERVFTEATT